MRQDAREARAFAYGDIAAAFETWLAARPEGPIVIAGVEQGGELADRLLRERIAPDPALRRRLVAAYLIQTTVPGDRPGVPPCDRPEQTGCLVAYVAVPEDENGRLDRLRKRALTWDARGRLVDPRRPPGPLRQPDHRLDRRRRSPRGSSAAPTNASRTGMGRAPGSDGARSGRPVPRRSAAAYAPGVRQLPTDGGMGRSPESQFLQSILRRS
jgi:hypothetical protein